MNEAQREEIARILEQIAADGLPHPRNLDAALDVIADTLAFPDGVLIPTTLGGMYKVASLRMRRVVFDAKYGFFRRHEEGGHLGQNEKIINEWVAE